MEMKRMNFYFEMENYSVCDDDKKCPQFRFPVKFCMCAAPLKKYNKLRLFNFIFYSGFVMKLSCISER